MPAAAVGAGAAGASQGSGAGVAAVPPGTGLPEGGRRAPSERVGTGESAVPADPDGAVVALDGAGGGLGGVAPGYEAYVRTLRARIQAHLAYPAAARRRGIEGAVVLEIHLDRQGGLLGIRAVEPRAAPVLVEAARRAVEAALPLPPPAGLPPRALIVRLPVSFVLR